MAKSKRLRDLAITEVSSVDRGAGENCRVILMKRLEKDEAMDSGVRVTVSKDGKELFDLSGADAIVEKAVPPTHADIAAKPRAVGSYPVVTHVPASAFSYKPVDITSTVIPTGTLQTEALTKLRGIAEQMRLRDPGLSLDQAFARALETPDGMKLYTEHRNQAIYWQKMQLGQLRNVPASETEPPDRDSDSRGPAYHYSDARQPTAAQTAFEQMVGIAAKLRKAEPKLSEAAAFAKAFTDPANAALAADATAEGVIGAQRTA
jgi:hypothetical protein